MEAAGKELAFQYNVVVLRIVTTEAGYKLDLQKVLVDVNYPNSLDDALPAKAIFKPNQSIDDLFLLASNEEIVEDLGGFQEAYQQNANQSSGTLLVFVQSEEPRVKQVEDTESMGYVRRIMQATMLERDVTPPELEIPLKVGEGGINANDDASAEELQSINSSLKNQT